MKNFSVVNILLDILNGIHINKVDYAIAQGMLKNFNKIPEISIHKMSELCFVSTSSLSRFVKKNGFESYIVFKDYCKNEINIDVDYSNKIKMAQKKELDIIFEYFTKNVESNLIYNLEMVKIADIENICKIIHDAVDVAFLGLEFANIIGRHFQLKLAECNRFVQVRRHDFEDIQLVENLEENGVAIIASLEGGYFFRNQDVIKKLKEKNTTIIAITMENSSKVFRDVDYFIFCNNQNLETEGRISLLYTIELLIMAYYVHYK